MGAGYLQTVDAATGRSDTFSPKLHLRPYLATIIISLASICSATQKRRRGARITAVRATASK